MMGAHGFVRSAVFAAAASAGWLAWAVVVGPLIGVRSALTAYLVVLVALYVATLPDRARASRRAAISAGAGLLAVAIVFVARGPAELGIGLALVIGLVRSAVLCRAAPGRAVLTEVALLGGGLLFARALVGLSLLSVALAVWGFLLVQSFFFLIPGSMARETTGRQVDPFDDAHRRALAVLERDLI
jgi:hypothetical protein